MPDTGPEQPARAATMPIQPPKLDRLAYEPQVDWQARHGKRPLRHAGGAQRDAERDKHQAVAERDAGVALRVCPREHAQARSLVLLADAPAQSVEVRELPREEQAREKPAAEGGAVGGEEELTPGAVAGGRLAGGGGPAHERGDATDHGADPSVECRDALERSVDTGIEDNVGGSEKGDGGVDAEEERAGADAARENGKERGPAGANQPAHQGPIARARHLGVGVGLVEHVEGVGAGGTQCGAGGEEEQREGAQARRLRHGRGEHLGDRV